MCTSEHEAALKNFKLFALQPSTINVYEIGEKQSFNFFRSEF